VHERSLNKLKKRSGYDWCEISRGGTAYLDPEMCWQGCICDIRILRDRQNTDRKERTQKFTLL